MDQANNYHSLADYRGEWLVLYFYPRDDTPGCTRESCNFRDANRQLERLGARVLGISLDNPESHANFAGKFALPFTLLSDLDGNVARAYGALFSLGPVRFARRHTFIINPDGIIEKIYRKVKPGSHSGEVMADLESLNGNH